MKLNKGNRVKYNDLIYEVVAIIWTTLYLRVADKDIDHYDYEMKTVYEHYKDIEFLKG